MLAKNKVPQPNWPFPKKPLPPVEERDSVQPMAPYPYTFTVVADQSDTKRPRFFSPADFYPGDPKCVLIVEFYGSSHWE